MGASAAQVCNNPPDLSCVSCCAGNRPSTSLLLPELSAYTVGQLLSLYEHQVAVQVGGQHSMGTGGLMGRDVQLY